jgi:hypothetical protein
MEPVSILLGLSWIEVGSRNHPLKCHYEGKYLFGLTIRRALHWWKIKRNRSFPLISNGTAPTRSTTPNSSKPHTHASLTHCHPKQVTTSPSNCKLYFETALRPTIFNHDFLNLQDVINEQLDLFEAQAATTAVNNSQSNLDDDLPHCLNDVS